MSGEDTRKTEYSMTNLRDTVRKICMIDEFIKIKNSNMEPNYEPTYEELKAANKSLLEIVLNLKDNVYMLEQIMLSQVIYAKIRFEQAKCHIDEPCLFCTVAPDQVTEEQKQELASKYTNKIDLRASTAAILFTRSWCMN